MLLTETITLCFLRGAFWHIFKTINFLCFSLLASSHLSPNELYIYLCVFYAFCLFKAKIYCRIIFHKIFFLPFCELFYDKAKCAIFHWLSIRENIFLLNCVFPLMFALNFIFNNLKSNIIKANKSNFTVKVTYYRIVN